MVACVSSSQDGFLYIVPANQDNNCESEYIMLTTQDYGNMMNYTRLDAATITESFSYGFAAVLFAGFISTYAIKIALRVVRLI